MKTWHFEMAAVATVLGAVLLALRASAVEWLGAGAVLAAFGHAQVADRMTNAQAKLARLPVTANLPGPGGFHFWVVPCWRWSRRYWLAKETLWTAYFALHGSWSALVGCGVFLAYPFWRLWWTERKAVRRA